MSFKVEVWGDYACFTRPEMKVERVSYDIMTPSAARGILESVYWHPGMRWKIDKIQVINPIKFVTIMRNEVKSKASIRKDQIIAGDDINQRNSTILKDVRYVIESHFEITDKANDSDNENKFSQIISRRLEKGQCFNEPCFGCREFAAYFKKAEEQYQIHDSLKGTIDLGYMLYDIDFSDKDNPVPMYYRAIMIDGIVDLRNVEVFR